MKVTKATQTATPKKTKNKKISITEFKAWLSGVEQMQPPNWAPSLDQWKLIKAKFESIDESMSIAASAAQQSLAPSTVREPQPHQMFPQSSFSPPPVAESLRQFQPPAHIQERLAQLQSSAPELPAMGDGNKVSSFNGTSTFE